MRPKLSDGGKRRADCKRDAPAGFAVAYGWARSSWKHCVAELDPSDDINLGLPRRAALLAVKVNDRLQVSVMRMWLTDKVKVDEFGVDDFIARFSQLELRILGRISRIPKFADYVILSIRRNAVLLLKKVIFHSDEHSSLNQQVCN